MYEVLTITKEKKLFIIVMMSALLAIAMPGFVFAEGEGGDTDLGEGQANAYQTFLDEHVKVQSPEAQDDYVSVMVDRPSDEDVQNGITEEMIYDPERFSVTVTVNGGESRETRCLIDDTDAGDRFVFTTKDKLNPISESDQVGVRCVFNNPDDPENPLAQIDGTAEVDPEAARQSYKKKSVKVTVTPKTTTYTYNGKYNKPGVTVKATSGGTTIGSSALSYDVTYSNSKNAGTAKVTVTMTGDYDGKGTATYTIKPRQVVISKVVPKTKVYTYNGKYKTPPVTITAKYKDTGKAVPASILNDLTHNVKRTGEKNRNVGTATVKVSMKNNYTSNTKAATFKINPKGTSIKSVAALKKGFTVKWTPQKTKMATFWITGYQVRYSLKKNMSGAKVLKVGTRENKDYKLASKKITKLKAKKTYYVQIRTYKKLYGKYYYSTWSKKKSVKTK